MNRSAFANSLFGANRETLALAEVIIEASPVALPSHLAEEDAPHSITLSALANNKRGTVRERA
jgi:hypothetical protein